MKSKSVVILGAKGMLGQELVRVFSTDKNYEVSALDKNDIDITDEKQLRAKLTELWPDLIINAAAYNAVDLCEKDHEEYKKAAALNAKAPKVLAEISKDLQAILVHYSSDYVFDGGRPRYRDGVAPGCCQKKCRKCGYEGPEEAIDGYREEDLPNPLSRYGKTKYEGEQAVEKNTDQFYIIRLSKLFGQPGHATDAKKSFFDVMLEKGEELGEVRVVDGETSNFTYAPDLAQQTKNIIDTHKPFGIYHITNPGAVTWYDAAKRLFELAQKPFKVYPVLPENFPRPAPRPKFSVLINTKLKPLRHYEEALMDHLKTLAK